MIINPLEIVTSDETVTVKSLIEHSGKKEYLWYSFPKEYAPYLTEKLDGFLVGLLLLAMKNGEDITVKGAVSEKLFFNLTRSFMTIIAGVYPKLKPVKITAEQLDDGTNETCEGAVGTGFSGGVDSFCTVHDHYFHATSPNYKITHFVFNNVGSHDDLGVENGRRLFNLRYDLLKGYPQEIGIGFIKIDSNLSDVLKMRFYDTHTTSNLSTVLCLQKLFSKYYYSSASQYQECVIEPGLGISFADPMAIHLLSTETFESISVGCEHTRLEKTRRMANVPNADRWLNVCVPSEDGKNCSMCWKCGRTMLALDVLGVLDDFGNAFDLKKWKRVKNAYLIRNLSVDSNEYEYVKEILEYADKTGYKIQLRHKIASKIFNSKLVKPILD